MTRDKCGVSILPEADKEGIVYMDVNSKIMQLTVTNLIETAVTLECDVLGPSGPFKVDNLIHVSQSEPAKLERNQCFHVPVQLPESPNPGIYSLPVAFMFFRQDEARFHIVKYIRAEISDEIVKRLQPVTPYKRQKPVAVVHEPGVEIERGEPPCMLVYIIFVYNIFGSQVFICLF